MRHFTSSVFLFIGLTISIFTHAQTVYFAHGVETFSENITTFSAPEKNAPGLIKGSYAAYLQFKSLPNEQSRKALENKGIAFIGYVHFGAYLTLIPVGFDIKSLADFGAKSIIQPNPQWKMHRNLKEPPFGEWAVHGSQVDIIVQVYPNLSIEEGAKLAREKNLTVLEQGTQNGYLLLRAEQSLLSEIAALPFIQWMELLPQPSEKEDYNGRSLHRANLLDSDHPLGKKYNGEGVNILVRDDGAVGPHIDFQGRLYNQEGVSSPNSGTHGDGVAGIIGGAGNIDPTKKGMAAGSDVYVINYTSQFQDQTLPLFLDKNVTITNTSYSNGCNAGYTVASQTVDQQIYNHPMLMHVFSAGNSNGSDCGYGAGAQWGNITGGHKMAKNAIATANLRVDGVIESSSSRGPAYDGRIKPDIAAHGTSQNSTDPDNSYQVFGGTSAAAPGIAGCLGQLTHAYKSLNNNEEAPTALLKMALLNTANEMGNIGPDFKFGWGHVNNFRALKLIEEQRYTNDTIIQGQQNTHQITIPAGQKNVRFMVYWPDRPADVNAARSLLNDLDLTVTGPDGTNYQPWKLNPAPNPTTLDLPAGVGRDSLNNMEQVAVNNPAGGVYTVKINGYEVPFGPQKYYLGWEILTDEVKLTYPSGGESFVPNTKEWIRWDAYGNTGSFVLKYSTNNGASYTDITTASNSARMYEWTVPNTISGNVKVVIVRGTSTDTTNYPINISPIPTNLAVTKVCPDSVSLLWTKVADPTLGYEVLQLGEKYMEPKGVTPANINAITFPIENPQEPTWFTIRTKRADGLLGRRANAIFWAGGLTGCSQNYDLQMNGISSPVVNSITSCGPVTQNIAISVKNNGTLVANGAKAFYKVNNQAAIGEPLPTMQPGQTINFQFSTPLTIDQDGTYKIEVYTELTGDIFIQNNTATTSINAVVSPETDVFQIDFEAGLPNSWSVVNPDNDFTWTLSSTAIGVDGSYTRSLYIDHYSYSDRQQPDYLYLPPMDLSANENPYLTFDYSHMRYSDAYTEQLRVEVFPNCNLNTTPVVVWEKIDPELSIGTSTIEFTPSAPEDWRKAEISLQQFSGQHIVLRITAINDYGNNLFLDNVAIQNRTKPAADFYTATSGCTDVPFVFNAQNSPGSQNTYTWQFGPAAQPSTATGIGPHEVVFTGKGIQSAQLIVANQWGADTSSQNISVGTPPLASFSFAEDNGTVQFASTSTDAGMWAWNFGDGNVSTEENPLHTYEMDGIYVVTVVVTNDCGTSTFEDSILISRPLQVSFTFQNDGVCAPVTASFESSVTSNVTSYFWEFPGGTPATSTEPNPKVTYETSGDFVARLTVSNGVESISTEQLQTVTIVAPPDTGMIITVNNAVVLFETAAGSVTSYSWDFGDGTTSNLASPTHEYAADGTFEVMLVVTNDCGTATTVRSISITTPPVADFSSDGFGNCPPFTVHFENLSSANSTAFYWEFPGGEPAFSTDTNPVVTYYNPGSYPVRLTASNAAGDDEVIKENWITVMPHVAGNFSVVTDQLTAEFTANITGAIYLVWNFGDGMGSELSNPEHTYPQPGNYLVILTATNGCEVVTFMDTIQVGTAPVAAFNITGQATGCAPFEVQFTDQSLDFPTSWNWTFENGTPSASQEQNPVVVFSTPGVHAVTLEVMNALGSNTFTNSAAVEVNTAPSVMFNYEVQTDTVSFEGISPEADTYLWDFGDGSPVSSEISPVHIYQAPGNYSVMLTVTNECGSTTFQQTVTVMFSGTRSPGNTDSQISVYPNPGEGQFWMSIKDADEGAYNLQLFNALGVEVKTWSSIRLDKTSPKLLDCGMLPSGAYHLVVTNRETYSTVRLIITGQ